MRYRTRTGTLPGSAPRPCAGWPGFPGQAARAIAGAIQALTDVAAELVGKPSQHAVDTVARRRGVAPHQLVIVGDDPHLEIAMARRAGALGVLVGGIAGDADLLCDGVHTLVDLLEPVSGGRP